MSALLGSSVPTLRAVFKELTVPLLSGDWPALLRNARFWAFAARIRATPRYLLLLRAQMASVLAEGDAAIAVLLRAALPTVPPAGTALVLSVLRLPFVTAMLQSVWFWALLLDREFVQGMLGINYEFGFAGYASHHNKANADQIVLFFTKLCISRFYDILNELYCINALNSFFSKILYVFVWFCVCYIDQRSR